MSVKQQAINGLIWNAIERFSTQGIQFVLTIIIARILSPDDYGLVAMLSIFMAIAQTLVDSGLSNALIQKNERTETDYCTAFYFNIIASAFIYLILYLSAPLIANFYNQPELVKVARVYGLFVITNSFCVVQVSRFTIALDFKKIAFSSLFSVVIGGSVGVWMAYQDYKVWALVLQALIGNLVLGISLWILARWLPKWHFSWKSFLSLFSFSSKLVASSLLHTLYINMYSLVVGKYFNAATLGYFNRAYTLGQFPMLNFGNIIQRVLYPIQCRYQDDQEKFNQIFISYLRISGFIMFPLMIGFAVLATPVISLLLTDKWLPMVPMLQLICLAMMWYPIMQANVSVLDAKGRTDYHLQSEIIKKIIGVLLLFSALPFGVMGVCVGMLIYPFIDLLIIIGYSRKLTLVGYKEHFKILVPSLLLALCMGCIVWVVTLFINSFVFRLLTGGVLGVLFYMALAYFLRFPELKIVMSFLKNKREF